MLTLFLIDNIYQNPWWNLFIHYLKLANPTSLCNIETLTTNEISYRKLLLSIVSWIVLTKSVWSTFTITRTNRLPCRLLFSYLIAVHILNKFVCVCERLSTTRWSLARHWYLCSLSVGFWVFVFVKMTITWANFRRFCLLQFNVQTRAWFERSTWALCFRTCDKSNGRRCIVVFTGCVIHISCVKIKRSYIFICIWDCVGDTKIYKVGVITTNCICVHCIVVCLVYI